MVFMVLNWSNLDTVFIDIFSTTRHLVYLLILIPAISQLYPSSIIKLCLTDAHQEDSETLGRDTFNEG